jgi:diguanylate cyclase (GGDEF)-like protein
VRAEKPDLVLLDVIMPDMSGFEVCKTLRDDDGNNLMPIIMLTAQENEDDKLAGLELGADDYIIKPFNPREMLSRVKNTLRRIDRNRRANPLTGLPGNMEILSEINSRIERGDIFSVVYADLDNFKAFNDVYGFANGDIAIKQTADIITDCVRSYGNQNDFIGHIGGDDFVFITSDNHVDQICNSIISEFDTKIASLYSTEDRLKGFIITKNRTGKTTTYPIMSISLGVVSNQHRRIINHIQVAEIAAELKKLAKSKQGSVYVKDRRTN